MDGDCVSIDIGDHEIWEQRRAKLKALVSVNGTDLQAELKYRVYLQLRAVMEEGNYDMFIEALHNYSAEERVSLSNIIDIHGPSGNSLLHVAAGIEEVDILRALLVVIHDKRLAAKANYRGDTPLHVAARAGRIRSAELLLGCGGIVQPVNDMGNTALHEAVKNGDSKLALLLLSRGSRAVYPENKESKCPLFLAVETGNLKIFNLMMKAMEENEVPWSQMQGMSPVRGALVHRRFEKNQTFGHEQVHSFDVEMLKRMSEQKKELFDLRDAEGSTPLHLAAYLNYVDGVKFLVNEFASSAFEVDDEGYLPIHIASKMGHLKIIKELLKHWPHPEELLSLNEGQNILHVAAKYGRTCVVNYIIGNPKHNKLINAKDKEGNTPLHVATLEWQFSVAFYLTRPHNKADLSLVNNSNSTALDIVEERKSFDPPRREEMVATLLKHARAPRRKDKAICQPKGIGPEIFKNPQCLDRLRNMANTRMLVATIIGTITFAAGFSVPGGYKGSEPDVGTATLLNKSMYHVFVICNMVAMYSSMIAVVILLWAQINDSRSPFQAVGHSTLPLLIALATMSVAFMAGIYVTVSQSNLIAVVTLIIGITSLYSISSLYIASFFWIRINWPYFYRPVWRFMGYLIRVLSITRRGTARRANRPAHQEN